MSSSSTSALPTTSTPTESADATKSLPTFDRFKRLKNLPGDPAHLQRFVTPRFCSPTAAVDNNRDTRNSPSSTKSSAIYSG